MGVKRVCCFGVELSWANLFKLKSSHHTVEEDFEESQVVSISGFHDLNPLNSDLEFLALMLSLEDW
jgi:hypothetical protein